MEEGHLGALGGVGAQSPPGPGRHQTRMSPLRRYSWVQGARTPYPSWVGDSFPDPFSFEVQAHKGNVSFANPGVFRTQPALGRCGVPVDRCGVQAGARPLKDFCLLQYKTHMPSLCCLVRDRLAASVGPVTPLEEDPFSLQRHLQSPGLLESEPLSQPLKCKVRCFNDLRCVVQLVDPAGELFQSQAAEVSFPNFLSSLLIA